jgi:hypothetical protein
MHKALAVATAAVTVAVLSSLIGQTIATVTATANLNVNVNVNDDGNNNIIHRRRRFKNRNRGLRGNIAVTDGTNMTGSRTNGGRKRNRIRELSSIVTSTVADAGIPPLTSFAIQNLAGSWDDIPILDGSLQLPPQQYLTPIVQDESNSTDINTDTDNSDDDDFMLPPIQPRIVGGFEDSDLDPFAMHLRYDEEEEMWKFAGCGGTLISRCHILTAGHCMTGDRVDNTKAVYVNAWRPFSSNTDASTGKTKPYHVSLIDFNKTQTHPKFNNTGNLNDIAVLTMTRCIPDDKSDLFEIMQSRTTSFGARGTRNYWFRKLPTVVPTMGWMLLRLPRPVSPGSDKSIPKILPYHRPSSRWMFRCSDETIAKRSTPKIFSLSRVT